MDARLAPLLLAVLLAAPAARATDLLDAWRAAAAHDPEIAAARAARAAGQARREQAGALWRPTVSLQAGVALADAETAARGAQFSAPGFGQSTGVAFDTSVTGGASTRYALSLRQPLYDRERSAQSEQLRIAGEVAERQWQAAQQALIVRSAERYFDAALGAHQLRLASQQLDAVERARVEAEDRFRIGDRPVTDVHEARARAAALQAQRLAAQSELEIRRARLADLMGMEPGAPLALPAAAAAEEPEPLAAWLTRAARDNPQVLLAEAQVRNAEQEARKTAAALSPTLDAVAQLGRERISGSGDFGSASNQSVQRAIGVQLTVPLYTGGWRRAKQAETLALAEQARAELEQARERAVQQARGAWLELSVARGRTTALESAWRASLARLDATQVGLQAGDRTTLDLLNAQNDTAAAELALLQARVQLQLQRLRLAAAAGSLEEGLLARVNAELAPPASGIAPVDAAVATGR
ncbi:TolC family outer membrane protein [Ramlibacter sp. AN1133]|uniref:TolC family outer membrane protein n=1 Tax=Ramlibacter sp. AN1133 TaxID=3133429 RepID=UPI0030BC0634